jgi:hypothetical protein
VATSAANIGPAATSIATAPVNLFMKSPSGVADALCRGETGTGSMHTVIPGRCAASNPEVRDSRFIISRFPVHRYAMPRNDRKTYGTNSSASTSISRVRVTSGQSRRHARCPLARQ